MHSNTMGTTGVPPSMRRPTHVATHVSTVDAIDVTPPTTEQLSHKQRRILEYLRTNAHDQTYFKSRLIARELGLSAKEVGSNMQAIADGEFGLEIEPWGYSSGTTWMVTSTAE